MTPGLWQILIVVVLFVVLFGGRGKISSILGDLGKGIKSFKKGMEEEPAKLEENKDKKEQEKA